MRVCKNTCQRPSCRSGSCAAMAKRDSNSSPHVFILIRECRDQFWNTESGHLFTMHATAVPEVTMKSDCACKSNAPIFVLECRDEDLSDDEACVR